MTKPGFGAVGMALAVALGPGSLACAYGTRSAEAPTLSTTLLTSDNTPVSSNARSSSTTSVGGSTASPVGTGTGLAARLERAAEDAEDRQEKSSTDSGTDSAPAKPPVTLNAALESRLIDFGRNYLEFDYREPTRSWLGPFQDLVTPELYSTLLSPLPAALIDSLVAQQRLVTAEFVAIDGVEARPGRGGVYQLSYDLTETGVGSGSGPTRRQERMQILVVVVDADELVEDIR